MAEADLPCAQICDFCSLSIIRIKWCRKRDASNCKVRVGFITPYRKNEHRDGQLWNFLVATISGTVPSSWFGHSCDKIFITLINVAEHLALFVKLKSDQSPQILRPCSTQLCTSKA